MPALSLRADLFAPTGAPAVAGLTAIATRSLGAARLHANAGAATGSGADEELPRWEAALAFDYTFFRPSLLVVGALSVSEPDGGEPAATVASAGLRWQWTPDHGARSGGGAAARRHRPRPPAHPGALEHLRASGGWCPCAHPRVRRSSHGRSEQFYYPGSFNWQFLRAYPEAARLFHAFDYGHAVLYERLATDAGRRSRLARGPRRSTT